MGGSLNYTFIHIYIFQYGTSDVQCQQQYQLLQKCRLNCLNATSNSSTQAQSQCFFQCQNGITFSNVLDVFHKIYYCIGTAKSSSSDQTTNVPAQSSNSTNTQNNKFITQISSCAGKVQNPCQISYANCLNLQSGTYNCFTGCLKTRNSVNTFTSYINAQGSSQMQQSLSIGLCKPITKLCLVLQATYDIFFLIVFFFSSIIIFNSFSSSMNKQHNKYSQTNTQNLHFKYF
ncbi:hypothetical protein ABPG72_021962 [Tetrahymena utriculariae]